MANLFNALHVSSGAIRALQSALEWSQNNVSNASTPGYVKQRASLSALPADIAAGSPGGVRAGTPSDSRNQFAEAGVWRQVQSQGYYSGLATTLSPIVAQFDVTGTSGIPGALNKFFQAASSWSVSPNSATSKQDVFLAADRLAASFREMASTLNKAASGIDTQLQSTVQQINAISSQLAGLNARRLQTGADPGLDAQTYAALEDLSALADFTTVRAPDGSLTVLLGGQTPLVIGTESQAIRVETNTGQAVLRDAAGRDITAQASLGTLGGLIETKNEVLPSILGNGSSPGDLNRLASALADRINGILASAGGSPIFEYNLGSGAALSLRIDPAATSNALPTALDGVSNGVAIALASMQNSTDPADQIDGLSMMAFYGAMGGRAGQVQAAANAAALSQASLVAQARGLRDDLSGVSLDEEAVLILQYQKGYQAAAQMVTVINDLADTVLGMLR